MRHAPNVSLAPSEREVLERWVATLPSSDRVAVRAQIVLEAAGGRTNGGIARLLGVHPETVARWRHRFVVNRLEGLRRDAPRSRRSLRVPPDVVERIVHMTVEEPPPQGTRWTTRSLARALQVNHMLVHRVWRAHGLSPATGSEPPGLPLPVPWIDVLGVYLDTPAAAVVFGVELRAGEADRGADFPKLSSDVSGGSLFSDHSVIPSGLVSILTGAEELLPRAPDVRRSPHELLVFLRTSEEASAPSSELHVVLDRPLEYVSPRVGEWFREHPRFRVHTTPPEGSWNLAVEEWLRPWETQRVHRDSFRGVAALTESVARAVGLDTPVKGRFSWIRSSGIASALGRSLLSNDPPTETPRPRAPPEPPRPT